MNEIQSRMEALKIVHAELLAMPDPQPEHIEALGEEVAALLRDAAATLSELSESSTLRTTAATEAALRVVAELAEAMTTLDGAE